MLASPALFAQAWRSQPGRGAAANRQKAGKGLQRQNRNLRRFQGQFVRDTYEGFSLSLKVAPPRGIEPLGREQQKSFAERVLSCLAVS